MTHNLIAASVLILFGFTGCGGDQKSTGSDLYRRYGCSSCHAAEGGGGALGPSLLESDRYWNRDSMTDFLVDPTEMKANDPRLVELSKQFNTHMRPFRELTREQLEGIADFVLSLD